jgi:hypothetical protein
MVSTPRAGHANHIGCSWYLVLVIVENVKFQFICSVLCCAVLRFLHLYNFLDFENSQCTILYA